MEDDECASVIEWISKCDGIFALKNVDELAKLWGTVKNRPAMNKEKFIRAMRTYYAKGILKKVKKLTLFQALIILFYTCIDAAF